MSITSTRHNEEAEREHEALRVVSSSPLLKQMPPKMLLGRGPLPVAYLPKVSFEEKLLKLVDQHNQEQIVSVLHAAKGKSIFQMSALDNPENIDTHPFKEYGEALSNFHQYFNFANMNQIEDPQIEDISYTITHGDGHAQNIFYTPGKKGSKGIITFIDNATFSVSLLKRAPIEKNYFFTTQEFGIERHGQWRVSILDDITKFVYPMLYGYTPPIERSKTDPLLNQMSAFIVAYIKAYPENQQALIWGTIEQELGATPKIHYIHKNTGQRERESRNDQPEIDQNMAYLKELVNEELSTSE